MNLDFIKTEKKKAKPRYIKPDSIKELERMHYAAKTAKHPNVPYLPKTIFRDDTANGLTKCITAWLKLNGHFGARVNVTGNYNAKLGKYVRSGSKKGMADITSVIHGKHVSIEVKTGRDRMREEQWKVKSEIEQAGGVYLIASTFDNFLEQIKNLENNKILQIWD